eukprot:SAG22_NODE_2141_length_2948_cov_1.249912_2_plen_77_part_00
MLPEEIVPRRIRMKLHVGAFHEAGQQQQPRPVAAHAAAQARSQAEAAAAKAGFMAVHAEVVESESALLPCRFFPTP